ncbi:hypothetical protein [Halorubrum sp. SD690R]|uniref:hypothetical protein n=1 Tax=Halorubrum sp. SD690R TaxID=2518117 RepID=UPI002685AB48
MKRLLVIVFVGSERPQVACIPAENLLSKVCIASVSGRSAVNILLKQGDYDFLGIVHTHPRRSRLSLKDSIITLRVSGAFIKASRICYFDEIEFSTFEDPREP